MRAISEFRQQMNKVLHMSFSINKYGFSGFECTMKYDCCEELLNSLKAIASVHNVDTAIIELILNDAQDLGRSYGYDQNDVLVDICFFYKDEKGHPQRLEQGKRYV